MRMTPLDVQNHRFAHRLRGYDPEEVDAFLRIVSEDYEALVLETASQNDRIRHLDTRIAELSAQEDLLKETLLSAQAMTEELRCTAEREAELRLAEVEVRAEKILDASHRRAAGLAQDIREMRALRIRLAESFRSAAETHLSLLETLETDPEKDPFVDGLVEGTVAYLKRETRSPYSAKSEHPESSFSVDEPAGPRVRGESETG